MSRAVLTCPYCNSTLTEGDVVRRQGKVLCPRCQEPLPALLAATLPVTENARLAAPHKQANRRLGLWILSGMTVVALAALVFALLTRPQRRARDPHDPEPLRFLPRDSTIALGLRVSDMFKDPDAASLLQDPLPAWLDQAMDLIRSRTGLKMEDLEEIVAGWTLKDLNRPVTLVVRTLEKYSLEAVEQAARPATPTGHLGRPLYRFNVKPMGEAFLWCRGHKTLIFLWHPVSVTEKDLALVPGDPSPDELPHPGPLREFMVKRLEKERLFWLAGDLKGLAELGKALDTVKGAAKIAPWMEPLKNLRFVGLSLANEKKDGALTFRGSFQVASAEAATLLETVLQGTSLPDLKEARVTGPEPGAAERWVTWQARLGAKGIRALMENGLR